MTITSQQCRRAESSSRILRTCGILATFVFLLACGPKPAAPKRFALEGEVVILIPTMQRVVVRHGPIDGWSPAATMEYPVDHAADIARLAVGNRIQAVLVLDGTRYALTEIRILEKPE